MRSSSARIARRAAGLLAALTLLTLGQGRAAAEVRYAVVIGANDGVVDDIRLLYAERDAARVGDVLTRLAGVPAENLLLLRGATATDIERTLRVLKERIAADTEASTRSVVFIYYSGHADAAALHLRGARLSFTALKRQVRAIGADVSVFVIDACRSGGLTRVKGARPTAPFEIHAQDRLTSEGVAIITSSSEGEDAQESDRLKGGIFTHHFINGLIGAADVSGDRRITLSEAYRYAYGQTLRATTQTRVIQHPTYAFSLTGRQDLVLTQVGDGAGLGKLRLTTPGHYLLVPRSGGADVAAELEVDEPVGLLLVPGSYLVRRRGEDAVWEGTVQVSAGSASSIDSGALSRLPFRSTVRKGYGDAHRSAWSLGAGVEVGGPLLPDTGAGLYGALAAQLDLADLAVQLRLRYGASRHDNAKLSLSQGLLGADLGVSSLFGLNDSGSVAVGLGLRVGADWLSQRFDTQGIAPRRDALVGRVAPLARFEVAPTADLTVDLDCGADIYFLEERQSDASAALATPVVPFCFLGFGVLIP